MKVFKYVLWGPLNSRNREVRLPCSAKILHVGYQHNLLYLWALVNPKAELVSRFFVHAYTGEDISEDAQHVATLVTEDMVLHVFETDMP